jgi:hypothetical protein
MVRSGKLLVFVVSAAALAGCGSTSSPSAITSPTSAESSCPSGLASAFEMHLAQEPWGDSLPVAATVTEMPEDTRFASSVLNVIPGCVLRSEVVNEGGDTMAQQFLIPAGLSESDILESLQAAGYTQPFPTAEPSAWQSADGDAVGVYPGGRGGAESIFPDWASYIAPDELVLLGNIAF